MKQNVLTSKTLEDLKCFFFFWFRLIYEVRIFMDDELNHSFRLVQPNATY
jgi:hypothetical protein